MSESLGIKELYKKLYKEPRAQFPQPRERLKASDKHGVYIIYGPRGGVLHVGRTLYGKGGLHQRLKNHLNGSSSFTKIFLKGKGSKLRGKYEFSFLLVKGERKRALLKSFALGTLCPKHLGVGKNAAQ